jgi:hypothetical protein
LGTYTIQAAYHAAGGFAGSSDTSHLLTVSVAGTTTTAANVSSTASLQQSTTGALNVPNH